MVLVATLSASCSTIEIMQESSEFPRDTAVIIGERNYLLNPIKCAEIRDIDEKGELDCYDTDGVQSAPVSPAAAFQARILKSQFNIDWGTPEHQEMLIHYLYEGGMEQALQGIQESMSLMSEMLSIIDTIETSQQMDRDEIGLRIEGINASLAGGTPALRAHRSRMMTWHMNNSRYFAEKITQ